MTTAGAGRSALEARWHDVAPPRRTDSARATYDLVGRWGSGRVPGVDVPADPMSERHWVDAARAADFIAHVPIGPVTVVDLGPGDGWPSLPIASARRDITVVGVDPSPRRVAACRANARRHALSHARFVVGDAAAIPLATGAAGLVTASYALEEASDPIAALAEVRRVLAPRGALRAAYQIWRLPAPEVETVALTGDGERLLYTYVRRVQSPPIERRYTLVLPASGRAAALHARALVAASRAPHAYGETRLLPGSPLGAPLLDDLAPLASASLTTEIRRWSTEWLVDALRAAGFQEVRATVHPGELMRVLLVRWRATGALDALAPHFEAITRAVGEAAGRHPGVEMVTAIR